MAERLSWLADGSEASVRAALREVAPTLAQETLVRRDRPITTNPAHWHGSAVIDSHVVKFAWSEAPARRLLHEARMLEALLRSAPELPVPRVAASSADPVILVTRRVPGISLPIGALLKERRLRLASDLGRFLADLHDPALLAALGTDVAVSTPEPQADTASIRARLPRFLTTGQIRQMSALCEFADAALAGPSEEVLLHGDLHGDNLVLDPRSLGLRLVADFESTGPGDPTFDFRCLPEVGGTVEFLVDVVDFYATATGRSPDLPRVLGWHIRTMLGDALWRSEAKVALPGGGTPGACVEDLTARLGALIGSAWS
jgi:aminoglycoside phosphotransferase (APT) family kinase protein